jgi:choline-glycine betaine transporter
MEKLKRNRIIVGMLFTLNMILLIVLLSIAFKQKAKDTELNHKLQEIQMMSKRLTSLESRMGKYTQNRSLALLSVYTTTGIGGGDYEKIKP